MSSIKNDEIQREHQALLANAQAGDSCGQTVTGQTKCPAGQTQGRNQSTTASAQQQNAKTVVGVFTTKQQAEASVSQLRQQGFRQAEISIVTKGHEGAGHAGDYNNGESDSIADGVATGGAIGGLGGLMAAAGVLAIPGFGAIVAMGPIAAALSGVVAGGVAGGLIDYGIPEESGREYEAQIRQGKVLAIIRTDFSKVSQAADILRQNGARDVEIH